ncbi:MAG: DUF1445 domain-containing protein [Deltaproteobacteria bacterium]|nr:DUF1445 domain-containing protein [Deltaproteobacteria bacterium]
MFTTNRKCIPAGPFSAQLVVTIRPMTPQQAIRAVQVNTRLSSDAWGSGSTGRPC